ncbi:MAG: 8-amino-7-oxononanoate synthase [Rikenellaceae bacterium]|nr:8-amino-7-oxononanoate synthase [Rikenellaceae bacterium]MCL2692423.1 8-amino-7-oxononanoate synthase [Rikenellaceae bacterium]
MNEIDKILDRLAAEDNLRTLRTIAADGRFVEHDGRRYVNLSSNDYLGIAADVTLQHEFFETLREGAGERFVMGNPSSRLITGNSMDYSELETALAALYFGKTALVLGSGYLANAGVLPAIVAKNDLVLADKLVHASILDGLRLCGCEWRRFAHNDMEHLEGILRRERGRYGRVWVVTESIFSMDGDRAPLVELVALRRRYDLNLYLDEAHAFGVCGNNGAGCAAAQGLDNEIDVIVGTFGKAVASYGAFVAVAPVVRELLVNRMRTLIFATALPPVVLQWTRFVVERLALFDDRRAHLQRLTAMIAPAAGECAEDMTQIVPIMAGSNSAACEIAEKMRKEGFWVTPIRHPTVPRGKARVRLSLTATLMEDDIEKLLKIL